MAAGLAGGEGVQHAAPPPPVCTMPACGGPSAPPSEGWPLSLDFLLRGAERSATGSGVLHDPLGRAQATSLTLQDTPWRCLEKHAVPCDSCVPAPAPHEAHLYRLISRDGQRTERRLRALLMAAPEWTHSGADASLQLAEASALDDAEPAPGESSSAPAPLRRRACADACRRILLMLAFQWRYKSDCWSMCAPDGAAGERKRDRRRSAAADGPEEDALPTHAKRAVLMPQHQQHRLHTMVGLFDRTFTSLQVVQGQVAELMTPFIAVAARAWTGPRSAVQYGRARGEGMTWMRVRSAEGASEVARWMERVCAIRLQAIRSWRDALGEARALACTVSGAYNTPGSELDALRYIVSHSRAATEAVAEASRQPDGRLRPQDAAWLQDYLDGHNAIMAMLDGAQARMELYRMEPMHTYLAAAERVVDGIRMAMRATKVALMQRMEWAAEAAESQGPAAGDKALAWSVVPPLVKRLRLTSDNEHGVGLLALATTPPPPGRALPPFVLTAVASQQN